MAKPLWVPQASPPSPRLLQSRVVPGTSTPRGMQGDGTSSGMMTKSQRRSGVPLPRAFAAAAAIALLCATLSHCTGEQFKKRYILPPGALEQIPIGASQDQVLIVLRLPSTVATLNGDVFYYLWQRSERP